MSYFTLTEQAQKHQTLLCLGFDLWGLEKIDPHFSSPQGAVEFFHSILELLQKHQELPACIKIQSSFVECFGAQAYELMQNLILCAQQFVLPVIWDAKRGDIGNSNLGYTRLAYDLYKVQSITAQPYMGAIKEFLRPQKTLYVLGRTSNPEASFLQNQILANGQPYYQFIMQHFLKIRQEWNEEKSILSAVKSCNDTLGFVVGATVPDELNWAAQFAGENKVPLLIPGIGKQGGDLNTVMQALNYAEESKWLARINVSRSVAFAYQAHNLPAKSYAAAALLEVQKLNQIIRTYL